MYRKYVAYVRQESYEGEVIRHKSCSIQEPFRGRNCKTADYLIERQALVVHALYKSRMTRWLGQAIATRVRVHKTDVRIYYTSANEPLGGV